MRRAHFTTLRRRIFMTEPDTLHDLSYLIDTNAWLDQRTDAHQSEHTSLLQDFVRCDVFDEYRTSTDMAGSGCGAPRTATRSATAP
jgi:hypothetical protein